VVPVNDETHTWQCPDCPKKNPISVWQCICGHKREKPNPRSYDGTGLDRRLCSYMSNGKQCPLPGDMSDSIKNDQRRWCSGHLRHSLGPIAEQIYDENVQNFENIMARLRDSNDLMGWWQRQQAEQKRMEAIAALLEQPAPEFSDEFLATAEKAFNAPDLATAEKILNEFEDKEF
jgi:hypothetical protein